MNIHLLETMIVFYILVVLDFDFSKMFVTCLCSYYCNKKNISFSKKKKIYKIYPKKVKSKLNLVKIVK